MAHYPVLLNEVLEYLSIDASGLYVDCTLGESHYAEAILARLDTGRLIAIDRDRDAIESARRRLSEWGERVSFHHGSYGDIETMLGAERPQGIVADLGLSRGQFETPERGFSFQQNGPLDMRMDRTQQLTAATIVNHYDEREIADLIYGFGEERRSRRIAKAIVRGRPIRDTVHLAGIVARAVPRTPRMKIHPATKTFQAIRIAVNAELEELDRFLETAPLLLAPGGRMAVVSFHSLEDRRVKQAFRGWQAREVLEPLHKRVVRPTDQEIAENPASRSAKLRAAERTLNSWLPLN
ncbi:MAG: 16S rRNA (cytosine(1402)-N(4))-methyltransferase RsmH [Acidobacteria bacterium]|nr:16S rRNA (cytosine(1402)-N(4))-methyltransferase RsmH [Acidobacteriota bacterium]